MPFCHEHDGKSCDSMLLLIHGACSTCSQANRRGRGMSHFMNAKLARSSSARQPLTGSTFANAASLQHGEARTWRSLGGAVVQRATYTYMYVTIYLIIKSSKGKVNKNSIII